MISGSGLIALPHTVNEIMHCAHVILVLISWKQ